MRKTGHDVDFEPGRDFHPVTKLPQDGYVYIVLPSISGPHAERMRGFRASWILRRSIRPASLLLPRHRYYTRVRARKNVRESRSLAKTSSMTSVRESVADAVAFIRQARTQSQRPAVANSAFVRRL